MYRRDHPFKCFNNPNILYKVINPFNISSLLALTIDSSRKIPTPLFHSDGIHIYIYIADICINKQSNLKSGLVIVFVHFKSESF